MWSNIFYGSSDCTITLVVITPYPLAPILHTTNGNATPLCVSRSEHDDFVHEQYGPHSNIFPLQKSNLPSAEYGFLWPFLIVFAHIKVKICHYYIIYFMRHSTQQAVSVNNILQLLRMTFKLKVNLLSPHDTWACWILRTVAFAGAALVGPIDLAVLL